MGSTGNVSPESALAPARAVADLTDEEIVDAIARLYGAVGFDDDDPENLEELLDSVGVALDDSDATSLMSEFSERLSGLVVDGRLVETGYRGLRLTWEEWGGRVALALGRPERAAEIAEMLAGKGDG